MAIIVPDLEQGIKGLDLLADYKGDQMATVSWTFNFDTGLSASQQIDSFRKNFEALESSFEKGKYGVNSYYFKSREINRDSFYSLSGGLFYLEIFLSIVFIFAAVLIIYY